MSDWLEPPSRAPDFALPDQEARTVRLSDFLGRPVVLYFYPKDDTPGCTKQACAFRDASRDMAAHGAIILGVSPDDVESHRAFSEKHRLNFPILADPQRAVLRQFGAWRERYQYGRRFMGVQRSTFLIDPHGRVFKVWKSVRVAGHEQRVLAAMHGMAGVLGGTSRQPRQSTAKKHTSRPPKRPGRA